MHKVFGKSDLIKFLKAMDSQLDRRTELFIIGGAAAALAYKVTRATHDIDILGRQKSIIRAYEEARSDTGLEVAMEVVGVHEAPYEFEDRAQVISSYRFEHLVIKVPEIHDLILMKTTRGYEHDFEAIEEMIKKNRVSIEIIEERISSEMTHVLGNPRRLELNYSRLFELF